MRMHERKCLLDCDIVISFIHSLTRLCLQAQVESQHVALHFPRRLGPIRGRTRIVARNSNARTCRRTEYGSHGGLHAALLNEECAQKVYSRVGDDLFVCVKCVCVCVRGRFGKNQEGLWNEQPARAIRITTTIYID